MGFHAEDDEVLLPGLGDAVGGLHRTREELAVVLDEPHPTGFDGLQVRTPADKRHVLADQRELDPKHAADRAGPDDANPHDRAPDVWRKLSRNFDEARTL